MKNIKLKLNVNIIYSAKSIKSLGIKIDEGLTWNKHINIAIKLNQANDMFIKYGNLWIPAGF